MAEQSKQPSQRGASGRVVVTGGMWLGLIAAFLGWMFDGLEMGLYSIAVPTALVDLCGAGSTKEVSPLISLTLGLFLLGMASGGILFGKLGDRLGRVRAMIYTVLIYSVFTGLSGLSQTWQQLAICRFLGAVGLGGEWGAGVALVMETWPNASRPLLAGILGAAANFGFLASSGVGALQAKFGWSWRIVLVAGAAPAILTMFIRMCVQEPERWKRARERGEVAPILAGDRRSKLVGVAVGAALALGYWMATRTIISNAAPQFLGGQGIAMVILPLIVYMAFGGLMGAMVGTGGLWGPDLRRHTLLGAGLAAVAVLGMWGAYQTWLQAWVRAATDAAMTAAGAEKGAIEAAVKAATWKTTMWMAFGSIIGALFGGLTAEWFGRRLSYSILCVTTIASAMLLYNTANPYPMNPYFLTLATVMAVPITAFFGWLPLYLPELFPTRLRTTGEGFTFNAARVVSAYGALVTSVLVANVFGGSFPKASATMSLIYVVGLILIWFCPELKGKELPE